MRYLEHTNLRLSVLMRDRYGTARIRSTCDSGPAGSPRSLHCPHKTLWPRWSKRRTWGQQETGSEKGQEADSLVAPPCWTAEDSLRLTVLFRRRCPWPYAQFIAQMSMLRKSCNFSQDNLTHHFSLVLLKYQKHVWSQPMRAAGWNFCISNPVHTDGRKKERKMLKDQWKRAAGLNCSIFQASWPQRTRRISSLTGW